MSRCHSTRSWLHRDAATLPEGDRLLLEEHLQACARCRSERDFLLRVRDVGRTLPHDPIGPRGHQRAIARAMLVGTPVDAEPRTSRWQVFAFAGAFAIAVIAIVLVWARGTDETEHVRIVEPDRLPDPTPVAPRPSTSITSGTITRDGVVQRHGGAVPSDAELHTPDGASIILPAARIVLAARSTIRWDATRRTLVLRAGEIDLDVDPDARLTFSVVTERFTVEVIGTSFHVSSHGVSVARGAVRIVDREGNVLVPRLSAGETWQVDVEARPQPAPIPARTHLTRARQAFALGDCRQAEQHADAALDAGPQRVEVAEARTVLAECAQATGRLDEAIRRYDAIVTRFSDLATAETALIATARLEAGRGRPREARARYQRYLDRYPSGRFVADARRYLDR